MILLIGKSRAKKAFTLLETLIVLAIMTMFFAISVPLFSSFMEKSKLDTTARSVVSVLRTARGYAISDNINYDVVFDTSTTPDEYYIYDGAEVKEKKYKLPSGIGFGTIQFTSNAATFLPTGELDETNPDTSVELTDGDNIKTITVERTTGRVTID